MIHFITSEILIPITRIGADPSDSAELQLRKIVGLISVVFGAMPLMGVIGILLIILNEKAAGWSLICGASLMLAGVISFSLTHRFEPHNIYWCVIGILFVLLPDLFLGGFAQSGLMIIWAITSPFISLITNKSWHVLIWFPLFVVALILSGILPPYLHTGNNLTPSMIIGFTIFNIAGFGMLALISLYYFVNLNDKLVKELHLEQEKSDTLLLNILPKKIATILKIENRTIADQYDNVSVLFADVVNFTPMSALMTPVELVELLNDVFLYFDELVEKYNIEKIKTIGDCYMVAAGVPTPRGDHAHVLAHMALDVQNYFSCHEFGGKQLNFRIGINSGQVVAGVIGRKKFIYDLWGDVVNTASRMESHGVGGQIQITEQTYEIIKNEFICEPRGRVKVKGKGEMDVWHINGK